MTALTTIICAGISAWVAVQLRSPSGERVGDMIERTEHLAAVNTMHLMKIQDGLHSQEPSQTPDDAVG